MFSESANFKNKYQSWAALVMKHVCFFSNKSPNRPKDHTASLCTLIHVNDFVNGIVDCRRSGISVNVTAAKLTSYKTLEHTRGLMWSYIRLLATRLCTNSLLVSAVNPQVVQTTDLLVAQTDTLIAP